MTTVSTRELTTADGHRLAADLAMPADPVAAVAICHPHPLHGGSRHDATVDALFEALPAAAVAALRFDFRADHDGGRNERLDVVAALDALTDVLPDRPMAVAGYSFGAVVALTTRDERIGALVAIAPPLAMAGALDPPAAPTLVMCPRHDQFSPPDATEPVVATWPAATVEVVESADHFLHGHRATVAAFSTEWLLAQLVLTTR